MRIARAVRPWRPMIAPEDLGAVYVRAAQYLLPAWAGFFATGLGLLLVLLVFPGGLGEVTYRLRDRFLRWLTGERAPVDRREVQS